MPSHTMGLIAETAVPSSGHITFESQLGKDRITVANNINNHNDIHNYL